MGSARSRAALVAVALPTHFAISAFWTFVLARLLPKRRRTVAGAVAGAGIAYLDLDVLGRWFPRIRALPRGPQFADHVLFGALVGHLTAAEG